MTITIRFHANLFRVGIIFYYDFQSVEKQKMLNKKL